MIGIICALESEAKAVCSHMHDVEEKKLFNSIVWEGKINDKDVVVALSKVGKVQAAISTTLLLVHYPIEQIINVGVAGGLCENQNVLDVVIGTQVIQHDMDTSAVDGENGIGAFFSCDKEKANQFANILTSMGEKVWIGDVASGDVFVTKDNHLKRIKTLFPTCLCAEMEAGAIAQVCNEFDVPCLIVRALSDIVLKEGNAMDFVSFVKKASKIAGEACEKYILSL